MPRTLKVRAERVAQGRRKPLILPSILPSNIHRKIYTFRGTQNPYLTRPRSKASRLPHPRPKASRTRIARYPKSLPYADIFTKFLPYAASFQPTFRKELKILTLRLAFGQHKNVVVWPLANIKKCGPLAFAVPTPRFGDPKHKMWSFGQNGTSATKKMWCSGHNKMLRKVRIL